LPEVLEHREVIGEKNEPDKPIPTLNVCAFAVERMQRSARVRGKEDTHKEGRYTVEDHKRDHISGKPAQARKRNVAQRFSHEGNVV
jgi:hypothetical protein